MTRKQHKCQYVQEQGVIFSRWIFFFPQLGKAQQCMGNKIFSVFSSPKMQLKHKGYLCVHWMREKKNEAGSSGKGAGCVLSFTCLITCEVVVLRPHCCPALVLSSFSPPSPWDVLSLNGDLQGSLAQSYKEQQSQLLTLVQSLFLHVLLPSKTGQNRYFKMSAWHCGINII